MKVLMVPLIVMSAVAGELTQEPDEAQMRGAFEQSLIRQVRNVIDFAGETGGPQTAQAIQRNGTDGFQIRAFQKRGCARLTNLRAYQCDFTVDIAVMNGSTQHALSGRFFGSPQGLMFSQEEPQLQPHVAAGIF